MVESDRELRQLLKDISRSNKELSILEVIWWIRSHKCNQAEIPQAIFRVGKELASVIYLEETCCWEVRLGGSEYQFDTFKESLRFIEQCRIQRRPPFGTVDDQRIESGAGNDGE